VTIRVGDETVSLRRPKDLRAVVERLAAEQAGRPDETPQTPPPPAD
jgi:hypothetical protein